MFSLLFSNFFFQNDIAWQVYVQRLFVFLQVKQYNQLSLFFSEIPFIEASSQNNFKHRL